jgi:hypothetical protein
MSSTVRALVAAVALAVLLSPSAVLAYPRDSAALVGVTAVSRLDILRLNELGMDIVTVRDGVAEIAATPDEIETLWANGFRPTVILSDMRSEIGSLTREDRGEYHSYSELTSDLADWAAAYPSITELASIGSSFQGRDIWALKISDNPGLEECEPEIQWIGGHHGNESISVEVCYYAALHLLENYGTDPRVTWLVNEREIWVIPLLNPDGHEAGSRYNAQGTDLNRNYLCPCGCNAAISFSAPETRALRDFNVSMNPVTSLTFHSGAVYVNYLWDYTYVATPDEPMIMTLSEDYASTSGYPVTNGADWYVAHGTCQDWCYDTRGEIDTTIEISLAKEPPESEIDALVALNLSAMLRQAGASGRGIRGVVTDGGTGEPLAATISIPEIGKDVYTDPDVGDYHRMVESGTYTVVASADGYPTQTAFNVSASLDTFTVVDFTLEVERGAIGGYVRDTLGGSLSAAIEVVGLPSCCTVSDPASGYYEIADVPSGERAVRASKLGYSSAVVDSIVVEEGALATVDLTLVEALFYDDAESGSGLWSGQWDLTTESSHSGSTSFTDSPGGDYTNGVVLAHTLGGPLDLTGAEEAALVFWHRYDTESGYDYCHVEVTDGRGWTRVTSYSGSQPTWEEVSIDVSDYAGTGSFQVRFVLDSDGAVTADGWYVDDVHVFADGFDTGVDDEPVGRASVRSAPNPFISRTVLSYVVPDRGPVDIDIYDVSGRLVRKVMDGVEHGPGEYETDWDGRVDGGTDAAAGVYFVRLSWRGGAVTAKMMRLK